MDQDRTALGVRELRADLAALLRRAGAGQRLTVSVSGRPLAMIGPVETAGGDVTFDALAAAGLLVPARRADEHRPQAPVPVWSGVRLDRAFREVRG